MSKSIRVDCANRWVWGTLGSTVVRALQYECTRRPQQASRHRGFAYTIWLTVKKISQTMIRLTAKRISLSFPAGQRVRAICRLGHLRLPRFPGPSESNWTSRQLLPVHPLPGSGRRRCRLSGKQCGIIIGPSEQTADLEVMGGWRRRRDGRGLDGGFGKVHGTLPAKGV
jgi:hypothetical protein